MRDAVPLDGGERFEAALVRSRGPTGGSGKGPANGDGAAVAPTAAGSVVAGSAGEACAIGECASRASTMTAGVQTVDGHGEDTFVGAPGVDPGGSGRIAGGAEAGVAANGARERGAAEAEAEVGAEAEREDAVDVVDSPRAAGASSPPDATNTPVTGVAAVVPGGDRPRAIGDGDDEKGEKAGGEEGSAPGIAGASGDGPALPRVEQVALSDGAASIASQKPSQGSVAKRGAIDRSAAGEQTGAMAPKPATTTAVKPSAANEGDPPRSAPHDAASAPDAATTAKPTGPVKLAGTAGSSEHGVEDSVVETSAGDADARAGDDAATWDDGSARNPADEAPAVQARDDARMARALSGRPGSAQAASAQLRVPSPGDGPRAQGPAQQQQEPGDSGATRSEVSRVDHGAAPPSAEGARSGAAGEGHGAAGGKGEAARPGGPPSTIHLERALAAGAERDVVGRLRHDGEMRLTLEPRGLGELEVRVAVRDGGVHASVATASDDARALLASQRTHLESALERYNLRLDSFSVGVGSGDGRPAFERDAHGALATGRPSGPPGHETRERTHETPGSLGAVHGGRLSVRA